MRLLSQTRGRFRDKILAERENGGCTMTKWTLPEIDLVRCDLCGACVACCPTGAVEMGTHGPSIVRPADCTYCADCEPVCPQGAIRCTYEIVWGPKNR
jgi:ferredoxin